MAANPTRSILPSRFAHTCDNRMVHDRSDLSGEKTTLRVCPKCAYVDPPEWRHSKFSYWIDFCQYEDFKKLHPKLAMDLEANPKLAEDKHYIYRLTKTGKRVHRKAKVDYGYQWTIPMEKHTIHPIKGIQDYRSYWPDLSQTKLVKEEAQS